MPAKKSAAAPRRTAKPVVIDNRSRIAMSPEAMAALGVAQGDFVRWQVDDGGVRVVAVKWEDR